MFADPRIRRAVLPLALLLSVAPGAVQGCSSPTAPIPPPSGGTRLALSDSAFQANVEPVLMRQGCDATGDCHGGGIRGTLQLSPPGAKDPQFDFDQVCLQVSTSDPEASPILLKPLALGAGGVPHSYKPFASKSDPDYQAILAWIMAAVPQ